MKKILKILGLMSLIPIILLSDFDPRAIFCSPDRGAVKVMKPIAKIIADDIVKNGIPKSLKDIKGLPYVLEGCEREEKMWKRNPYRKETYKKVEADYIAITESCFFINNQKKYSIDIRFTNYIKNNNQNFGELSLYNIKTDTGIDYSFKADKIKVKRMIASESLIYDSKTSGICTQFRQ